MSKVLGIEALAGIRDWVKSEDDAVKAELQAQIGSPLVASTVAGMTDQTKVYVYIGSETGYTAGNWYYYNGSAWTSGGVYNSTALETDTTLTIAGMAADAKATGDEITHVKQDISELSDVTIGLEWNIGYVNSYGIVTQQSAPSTRRYSSKIPCGANVTVRYMGESNHAGISVLTCYDNQDNVLQTNVNVGTIETEFTTVTPNKTAYVRLSAVQDKQHYVKTNGGMLKSYIDSVEDNTIDYVDAEIADVETEFNTLVSIIKSTAVSGDTTWVVANLKKGNKYKITNNASGQISASSWDEGKTGAIDTYGVIDSGKSLAIYPTANAYYLAYYTISGCGTVLIEDMSKRIPALENQVDVIPSTILLLGDSILGYDNSITKYLSDITGSEILNCAIGGTSVSARTDTTSPFYAFDGINLVTAIYTNDFTAQDASVSGTGSLANVEKLNILKTVDYSSIKLIVLGWGTNDYTQGKTIEQINTALNSCVDMLQQKNPLCNILILSPIWRYFANGTDSDTRVYNVSTLKEISEAMVAWAENKRISVLNSYQNFELNTNTMQSLCVNDDGNYLHLKPVGAERYAHLINGKIRSLY